MPPDPVDARQLCHTGGSDTLDRAEPAEEPLAQRRADSRHLVECGLDLVSDLLMILHRKPVGLVTDPLEQV